MTTALVIDTSSKRATYVHLNGYPSSMVPDLIDRASSSALSELFEFSDYLSLSDGVNKRAEAQGDLIVNMDQMTPTFAYPYVVDNESNLVTADFKYSIEGDALVEWDDFNRIVHKLK